MKLTKTVDFEERAITHLHYKIIFRRNCWMNWCLNLLFHQNTFITKYLLLHINKLFTLKFHFSRLQSFLFIAKGCDIKNLWRALHCVILDWILSLVSALKYVRFFFSCYLETYHFTLNTTNSPSTLGQCPL